jgi:hypothetical protein
MEPFSLYFHENAGIHRTEVEEKCFNMSKMNKTARLN